MINIYKMKAPGDHRPTWRNGIIQIHITRACDLACPSCTQGSNLGGKPTVMTLENFEIATKSLRDYYGVVGIFGGNPTLHPRFQELCDIFEQNIPFEQRGLWSNNLNGHGKLCRRIFNPTVSNLNVHANPLKYEEMKRDWPECAPIGLRPSRHSPPFVAMKDLDIPLEKQEQLIESCDINQLWSAMICQFRGELRAFFCELAAAQSMLHENDPEYPDTGLLVHDEWWKLPIGAFRHQIQKHCFECGIPLRGIGDFDNGTNEYVSETHLPIYNLKKPTGKTLHLVRNVKELNGHVNRATDYIANGGVVPNETKVLIAVPTSGFSRNDTFYDFYNALERPEGTICTFARGQSPARNRNLMIEQGLEHNCSHILFLDDDVAFPPDLLKKLLVHDKDIVTALYLMRNYPHQPILFDYSNEKGECAWHNIHDEQGLIEIINCGLGACLIKIDVFRKMEKPWITLGELEKDHWCDDVSFFNRARAKGFKLYCDLSIQVGHFVNTTVWPVYANGMWHVTYDTHGNQSITFPMPKLVVKDREEVAV